MLALPMTPTQRAGAVSTSARTSAELGPVVVGDHDVGGVVDVRGCGGPHRSGRAPRPGQGPAPARRRRSRRGRPCARARGRPGTRTPRPGAGPLSAPARSRAPSRRPRRARGRAGGRARHGRRGRRRLVDVLLRHAGHPRTRAAGRPRSDLSEQAQGRLTPRPEGEGMSTTTSSPLTAATVPAPAPDVEIVVPVHNEEASVERSLLPPVRLPVRRLPVLVAGHRRRQREHRRHLRRSPLASPTSCRACAPCTSAPRDAAAPCRRLVGERRPRAGVHGRRPVHRPGRAASAGRAAAVRAQRPGHRQPAEPRRARRPRAAARGHLALLQPAAAGDAGDAVLRRAVRVQGDPRDRARDLLPARRGHRLVLRHRAAGARRTGRPAHPRGARRLGRRPGLAGSTSCATASADLRGVARLVRGFASGSIPVATLRERLGRAPRRRRAASPASPRRSCGSPRSASCRTLAYLLLFVVLRGDMAGARSPTPPPCSSRRSRTPRPTAGTRSACAVAAACVRHQAEGLAAFGFALALTSGSLALLHVLAPAAGRAWR